MQLLLSSLVVVACASGAPGDWPQFRGPSGQGHAAARGLPLHWSETKNVTWKVPVPGLGHSSPVIGGDQIWMTTALDKGRSLHAVCFDRRTGRMLHNVGLFHKEQPGVLHSKNSHATPTPVLDGDRVYVHFGSHGTACLSTSGKVIWKNATFKYRLPHGQASSPVLFGDLLILSCDGTDVQFMVALDKRTGKVVWKRRRKHLEAAVAKAARMPASRKGFSFMAYATPLVIDVDGARQLVCPVADHVAAYDPKTGKEIWWCGYDGFSTVARPVAGLGLVFVVTSEKGSYATALYAIRPSARGKVPQSQLVWRLDRGVPHVPSPLLIGEELYLVNDGGVATCLDAKTGRVHWTKRVGGRYSASPIYADGRIYCCNEDGETIVLAPGKHFKRLATNGLEGRFMASPAVAGRALFLRTDKHLYRIEKNDTD